MKIFKYALLIFIFLSYVNSKDLNPKFIYNASGGVTELLFFNNKLYASTVNSSIDIFDLERKEKLSSIKIPKIKDFLGDDIEAKIYSLDILNKKTLILSQGNKGGRNINIYENKNFKNIISDKKRMFIAKAKFINNEKIIFALLSNEIYLYNLKSMKIEKKVQVSHSPFSNFVLTENKKFIITSDESGILTMLDTKELKVIKKFQKQNLDNVYQLDTKNGYIITAGQDRRSAFYEIHSNKAYHKKAPFLIYSTGLSPSGELGAIAINEENDVLVFNTKTKKDLYLLKGNTSLITDIIFLNEKEIFISTEQKNINYYNIN